MEQWMAFRCDYEEAANNMRVPRLLNVFGSLHEAQDAAQIHLRNILPNNFVEILPGEVKKLHPALQVLFDLPDGIWANELSWRADGSGGEPTGAIWWFAPVAIKSA